MTIQTISACQEVACCNTRRRGKDSRMRERLVGGRALQGPGERETAIPRQVLATLPVSESWAQRRDQNMARLRSYKTSSRANRSVWYLHPGIENTSRSPNETGRSATEGTRKLVVCFVG